MYCRTCGNKMNDNAEMCVKCGVRKNVGTDYCQVCGAKTTDGMTACQKCGAKLMKALSSIQMKKTVVSKGKRLLGNVSLVLGIFFLCAMIILTALGLTQTNTYESLGNILSAGRCGIIGGIFTGLGIRLRKK